MSKLIQLVTYKDQLAPLLLDGVKHVAMREDIVKEKNLPHRRVYVFLFYHNHILMKLTKGNPPSWNSVVCDYPIIHEIPFKTAIRAVKEQIGLDVDESKLNYIGTIDANPHSGVRAFNYVFTLKLKRLPVLNICSEDIQMLKWVKLMNFNQEGMNIHLTDQVFVTALDLLLEENVYDVQF